VSPDSTSTPWWRSRGGIFTLCFLAIAAFFLVTEHTAHVLGALPYLLLAACPLMHLFMHHGHHGEHRHTRDRGRNADAARASVENRP
jgi:DUF2933 family protein